VPAKIKLILTRTAVINSNSINIKIFITYYYLVITQLFFNFLIRPIITANSSLYIEMSRVLFLICLFYLYRLLVLTE
jgi:hypothetical protein